MDAWTEVLGAVYGVPPEDFIAARSVAVAAARKSGDRTLAAEIGKLRKPTVAAWLVNLLAHQRPELIAELLELGEEMRRAQRELRGAQLRELSQQRRKTVAELAREARALAVAAGRGVRDPLPLAEVEATLTAALADESVAEEVSAGRLTRAVEYAGFGELPRPQLRLVQGGREPAERPVDNAAKREPAERPVDNAAKREPAERPVDDAAKRRAAERDEEQRAEARRRAEEEAEDRAARAEQRAQAERAEAERAETTRMRKARAAAHRELLAARTELAEAEAARTAAERAVLVARRRVETALARATELGG